jgi:hypothetical protein
LARCCKFIRPIAPAVRRVSPEGNAPLFGGTDLVVAGQPHAEYKFRVGPRVERRDNVIVYESVAKEGMMAKRAGKRLPRAPRAARVFGASAELVRSAALVLDAEMAVGITAAKAVQQRLDREGRIDPADFREAVQKFQTDAHDLANSLDAQLTGSRLQPNVDLARRFITRANDMIDLAVGLVTTGAELANEFIQTNSVKTNKDAARNRKRRR